MRASYQEYLRRHPEIRQREQRYRVRRVLRQGPEANLQEPGLARDYPKQMFHPSPNPRLPPFEFPECASLRSILHRFDLAALDVATGRSIGELHRRHRSSEFLEFVWHKSAAEIMESVGRFCARINGAVH